MVVTGLSYNLYPSMLIKFPVPGSSMRFLEKSRRINVDTIAYDLEDSVTPGKKAEARRNLKDILSRERSTSIKEQAVRINSVDSGYALDDLTEVVSHTEQISAIQ